MEIKTHFARVIKRGITITYQTDLSVTKRTLLMNDAVNYMQDQEVKHGFMMEHEAEHALQGLVAATKAMRITRRKKR